MTSLALLRERLSGTLERPLTTPLGRLELLVGYALTFGTLATAQALVALTLGPLGLHVRGPRMLVVALAVCVALPGMGLGLLPSAFARTGYQVVHFLPVIVRAAADVPNRFVTTLADGHPRLPSRSSA